MYKYFVRLPKWAQMLVALISFPVFIVVYVVLVVLGKERLIMSKVGMDDSMGFVLTRKGEVVNECDRV